jgi:hypothetical protein
MVRISMMLREKARERLDIALSNAYFRRLLSELNI